MRVPAFWDSSALLPLCVRQSITPQAVALYNSHDAVVWWSTPVEIASALARLLRMNQLDTGEWSSACKLAVTLAGAWAVVQPSDPVRTKAMQLVDRYDLRAADALQLAGALEWCEHDPRDRVFLAADRRLREAALLTGFEAKVMGS